MSKINIMAIVSSHVGTLRNYRTGKISASDFFVFAIVPLAVAGVTGWYGISFTTDVLNGLLQAFSIFAGLLLNLLVLVCGFSGTSKFSGTDQASAERRVFLSEVNDNLSFSIVVSLAVVVLCVAVLGLEARKPDWARHPLITSIVVALVGNFVLTLLLVLKRVHALLSDDFKRPSLRKSA